MTTTSLPSVSALRVTRGDRGSLVGLGVLALIVWILAAWLPYHVTLGTLSNLVGLYVLIILATTWNLLAGYGGMVSIGQQAYIGIGGYGLIQLADALNIPPILAVPLTGVICALVALPMSYLVFRLAGGYFAIGTWVVAEVVKLITTQFDSLGGGSGLSLTAFQGVDRITRIATVYWVALAATVLMVVATYLMMRSRLGLGLTAIRDNPVAASSLGVEVTRSKRIVYVVAAAGAGIAGALIALNALRVTPDSIFSVNYTAFMIFIVVIGGIGSIEGPIIGAVLFWVLQQSLADQGSWYLIVLGVIAVVAAILLPKGLWGLLGFGGRIKVFDVGYSARPGADSKPVDTPRADTSEGAGS